MPQLTFLIAQTFWSKKHVPLTSYLKITFTKWTQIWIKNKNTENPQNKQTKTKMKNQTKNNLSSLHQHTEPKTMG